MFFNFRKFKIPYFGTNLCFIEVQELYSSLAPSDSIEFFRTRNVKVLNFKSKFKFFELIILFAEVFTNTTMMKTEISIYKRCKPTLFEHQIPEIALKSKNRVLRSIVCQNQAKAAIREKFQKNNKWTRKEEKSLMIQLLKNIIEEPYLNFSWTHFQDQFVLEKISRILKKSCFQCSQKINQIERVQLSNYSDLNVIDFLIVFWKDQNFKSKTGKEFVDKIINLKNTKSKHMTMCEQNIERIIHQQTNLMKLFDFIMQK